MRHCRGRKSESLLEETLRSSGKDEIDPPKENPKRVLALDQGAEASSLSSERKDKKTWSKFQKLEVQNVKVSAFLSENTSFSSKLGGDLW